MVPNSTHEYEKNITSNIKLVPKPHIIKQIPSMPHPVWIVELCLGHVYFGQHKNGSLARGVHGAD